MTEPTLHNPQKSLEADRAVSVTTHLEELRRRLGITLGAFLAGTALSFMQINTVIGWLRRPVEEVLPQFVFFGPTEALTAYMKVAGLCGIVLAMPVGLWQVWRFIRPGLTPQERRYGSAFVGWGSVLFLGGAAFAYFVLLPVSLRFLLSIGQPHLQPLISIGRYLSFVIALVLSCALVFQLPIVLYLLAKMGIVTSEWLRQQRAYAFLGLLVVAALATPTTDVVNLMLLALPLFVLYEVSIWVTRLAMRPPIQEKPDSQ